MNTLHLTCFFCKIKATFLCTTQAAHYCTTTVVSQMLICPVILYKQSYPMPNHKLYYM